jgi:3-hydroxyacyl-CoA dehydrogenase
VKDRKRTAMAAGVEAARALLEREAGRRGGAARAAVEPATGFGGFGTLDLVVAAVGATPEAARRALREAVDHTREECLLALAAPVVSLPQAGETGAPPGRLVGLHVAEPIEDFALLEILAGDTAPRAAVDGLVELARRMGRVPVRVADRPGGLRPRLARAD